MNSQQKMIFGFRKKLFSITKTYDDLLFDDASPPPVVSPPIQTDSNLPPPPSSNESQQQVNMYNQAGCRDWDSKNP